MPITYQSSRLPARDELLTLYDSVEWTAYTRDPERLEAAIAASLSVVTARDGNRLVGLARIVGDGLTIAYLQDLLVVPEYQRTGVGSELFRLAFLPYSEVRQKVLITDDEPRQLAFYQSMGFSEIRELEHPTRAFVRFS